MYKTCELIKKLRENTGLSATQFAEVMGVSKSSVSKWENNEVPSIERLYQIARYFRVTVDELLNGALKTDSNLDRLVEDYDLSSFDIPQLLKEHNVEEIVHYFKKCQYIKARFLKLLPRAAYHGLKDVELEEFRYISKYIFVDSSVIKYERDLDARYHGKLDPNEMNAVKEFYERIKKLPKAEKEWEIEKIYCFQPELYLNEIINTNRLDLFNEMFKLLPQADKDSILTGTVNRGHPLDSIRNNFVLCMIENGAKILYSGAWHSNYWEEDVIKAFEGDINYVSKSKRPEYYKTNYYYKNSDCSYSEYVEVIDEEKTKLFKEACELRKSKPRDYYNKLKSGEFDFILEF